LSKDCGTCSWLDIAKNATLAVKDAIAFAVEHGHLALEENKVQERLSICEGCEYLNGQRCRACGCFVKAKAALASENCPKKKWGQI